MEKWSFAHSLNSYSFRWCIGWKTCETECYWFSAIPSLDTRSITFFFVRLNHGFCSYCFSCEMVIWIFASQSFSHSAIHWYLQSVSLSWASLIRVACCLRKALSCKVYRESFAGFFVIKHSKVTMEMDFRRIFPSHIVWKKSQRCRISDVFIVVHI